MELLDGKKILITGGTGSFGNAFISEVLAKHKPKRLIVFSRDEMKQWEMRKRFPEIDFFIGDVRDFQRVKRAFYGVDIVIHAAALKIVPTGESDPLEYIKTNTMGAANVIEAALEEGVSQVVALSTDKACAPINLYGASKLAADRLFIAANAYHRVNGPVFKVVRYGNVMGSRGSVIPLFMSQAPTGRLTVTHAEMTRFMISLNEAVELVFNALADPVPKIHIPRLPAMKVVDIAATIAPDANIEFIGIRPGEKLHEMLDEGYTSNNPERWYQPWELKEWMKLNYGPLQSTITPFSGNS